MKAVIKSFDPAHEYFFAEGCYITELWNSADDPVLSVARARLEPGKTTRWHYLRGIQERYVVLEGTGLVEAGELSPQRVGPGDIVVIPPGARQRIKNLGSNDLIFLAICSPRFRKGFYVDVDD